MMTEDFSRKFESNLGKKMTLDEIIKKRRSVRKFQDKPVSLELLEELVALARRGPSAGALRGYRAIITKEKLAYDAPACVVVCVDEEKYVPRYGERGRSLYAIQDSAIFAAYLQLLLVDRGLSSVWVGAFREGRLKRHLATDLRPVAIIAIGYE